MQVDKLQHSSIQPWSAGVLFPFVIVQTETYDNRGVLIRTAHRAINGPRGESSPKFATYRKAAEWARAVLDGGKINAQATTFVMGAEFDVIPERDPMSISEIGARTREHVELPPKKAEWVRNATRAEVFERYPCPTYRNGRAV